MDTTADGPVQRSQRSIPWVLGGIFILLFLVRDMFASHNGVIDHSAYWGRDFANVWTGGYLARTGLIDAIYNVEAYQANQRMLFGELDPHFYSYPPVTFFIGTIFSLLPYPLALAAWTFGTCALFVWAAKPWWPKQAGPAWLAILTPAAIVNLWAGQYGILVGALFLLGWRNLDKHPRVAGIFFGLMLIKPHLAILVPLVLLIRRDWEAIFCAAGTVLALLAATIAVYGIEPWTHYLLQTSGVHVRLINAGNTLAGTMSVSTISAALRLGGGWTAAMIAYALVAGAALAMAAKAAIRRVETRELAFILATTTFLVVPYSFNYDLTAVMVGAVWLLTRENLTLAEERIAFYGFLAPQAGMVLSAVLIPVMPIMLLALAYAQLRVALRGRADVRQATLQPA